MYSSIFNLLEDIEKNSKKTIKENIIKCNVHNELLKQLFIAVLDPYTTYGIKNFKKPNHLDKELFHDDEILKMLLFELLPQLSNKNLSSKELKNLINNKFSQMNQFQQKWCERILIKNLRCGINVKSINKIWPNLLKKFALQLADTAKCEFVNGTLDIKNISFPVKLEPKIDGLRMIAIKKNGKTILYTKTGNVIQTLPSIKMSIDKIPFDNIVFDGEAYSESGGWNETGSVMMRSKKQISDANIDYFIFDYLPLNDWIESASKITFFERNSWLHNNIFPYTINHNGNTKNNLKLLTGMHATKINDIQNYYEECLNAGFEGLMIKNYNTYYNFKRSSNILKLKPTTTHEGVIVDYCVGKAGTKYSDMFGSFSVLLQNGTTTKVSTGFTNEFKISYHENEFKKYIGKIVECMCQPPLTKDGKMRFPSFIRFRDERDVDPLLLAVYRKYKNNCNESD